MARKPKVWRGSISIKQLDGTIVKVMEVEDITGVLGEPKVTKFMLEEEINKHNARMVARIARTAADLKDADGNPLLPEGTYNIMNLLRG